MFRWIELRWLALRWHFCIRHREYKDISTRTGWWVCASCVQELRDANRRRWLERNQAQFRAYNRIQALTEKLIT